MKSSRLSRRWVKIREMAGVVLDLGHGIVAFVYQIIDLRISKIFQIIMINHKRLFHALVV
jgi:hypothetical protein